MEIAYLCAARQADVLALTYSQLAENGIYIKQGKTGVAQIKSWTDLLRAAIKLSDTLPIDVGISSIYISIKQEDRVIAVMDLTVAGATLKKLRLINFPI